jgi:hypothetical protein
MTISSKSSDIYGIKQRLMPYRLRRSQKKLNLLELSGMPKQKDRIIVDTGNLFNWHHLITGDKDLLELKKFGKTRILTMREYLARK